MKKFNNLKEVLAAKEIFLESTKSLVEGAHCAQCDEFTHGSLCGYCFPEEASYESFLDSEERRFRSDGFDSI